MPVGGAKGQSGIDRITAPRLIAASPRQNERLRASQRGDAIAMVLPTLTARNPLPPNVLYKKNIPMPQHMIPKTQSDSKLPALWECTGASLGFHVFIHATGKARSGQTDSALREYLNTDTTKARQFLERHV